MLKRRPLGEELKDYIKKNLKKGYTKESLRWALINQGYSRMEVENAIKQVDQELANQAPILKTKPEITRKIIPVSEEPKEGFFKKFLSRLFS